MNTLKETKSQTTTEEKSNLGEKIALWLIVVMIVYLVIAQ